MESHIIAPPFSRTTDTNTMAPLMKKIAKHIDATVEDFCKQIATRFDLNATELSDIWKASQSGPAKKNTKKSGYVMFGLEVRPKIVAEHPEFTFAEISKEVGRLWKIVSADENEKHRYKEMGIMAPVASAMDEQEMTQVDVDEPLARVKPVAFKKKAPMAALQDEFETLNIKELKNACKMRGLRLSGKREELLERLRNAIPLAAVDTPSPKKATSAVVAPPVSPLAAYRKMAAAVGEEEEETFSQPGTPGSVILPMNMEEMDAKPIAPKKMHKKLVTAPSAIVAPLHKKKSKWAKLSRQELLSQCDEQDIDVDEDATQEELVYALDNCVSY